MMPSRKANWLVDGASAIARRYRISEYVIGATIVGMGTSMLTPAPSFDGRDYLYRLGSYGLSSVVLLLSALTFDKKVLDRVDAVFLLLVYAVYLSWLIA